MLRPSQSGSTQIFYVIPDDSEEFTNLVASYEAIGIDMLKERQDFCLRTSPTHL